MDKKADWYAKGNCNVFDLLKKVFLNEPLLEHIGNPAKRTCAHTRTYAAQNEKQMATFVYID